MLLFWYMVSIHVHIYFTCCMHRNTFAQVLPLLILSEATVSLEGDKVNLLCVAINDVHANYSLQINWYKGNKLITPNGKHTLIYNETDKTSRQLYSTLLFDPINYADDGEYTCRASNLTHILR